MTDAIMQLNAEIDELQQLIDEHYDYYEEIKDRYPDHAAEIAESLIVWTNQRDTLEHQRNDEIADNRNSDDARIAGIWGGSVIIAEIETA